MIHSRTLCLVALLAAVAPIGAAAQAGSPRESVPGLTVSAREVRYAVHADDLRKTIAILNETRLEGEQGPLSQGLTDYQVVPSWRFNPGDGECALSDVKVDVDITITLPRWPGVTRVPELERLRWREIQHRIEQHEYAHRDFTVEMAKELISQLRALRAGTCGALDRAAQGALTLSGAALRERHAAFDAVDGRWGELEGGRNDQGP